jgi:hypothetical protein
VRPLQLYGIVRQDVKAFDLLRWVGQRGEECVDFFFVEAGVLSQVETFPKLSPE